MNAKSLFVDRGRSFAKGDYLVHVSGVVGITTGEVIYEPKNPVEKTKIVLKSGHPLVDYSMKFCIASAAEQSNLYERLDVWGKPGSITNLPGAWKIWLRSRRDFSEQVR
jgi:hypothetical protein